MTSITWTFGCFLGLSVVASTFTQGPVVVAGPDWFFDQQRGGTGGTPGSPANFSGTWTVDAPIDQPPAGGGGGGRGGGGPLTVKQTADALIVERQGRQGLQTTTYKLDGTESVSPLGQSEAGSTARWDGSKLVITTRTEAGESTQTWSLVDGKLTIDRTGGRGPSTTTYKKTAQGGA